MITFQNNERKYGVLSFPSWMYASKLIADHVDRKESFIVDLATGEVSLMKCKLIDDILYLQRKETVAKSAQQTANNTEFYRDKLRKISADARAALGE